jgi:hypothetical protein
MIFCKLSVVDLPKVIYVEIKKLLTLKMVSSDIQKDVEGGFDEVNQDLKMTMIQNGNLCLSL